MKKLYGITTPIVTPFNENDTVDCSAMKEHIHFLLARGIHNIYPLGSIGEGILLSVADRKMVAETVVKEICGKVGVFIHVGALSLRDTIELAKHAYEIGADGIGVITPMFFHSDQEDMIEYYTQISKAVPDDFPIYMYNLPGMTGNDLLPETVAELAKRPNLSGIKNTMPSDRRISELHRVCREDFTIISGDDTNPLAGLSLGANGLITGTSNFFPELMRALYDSVKVNDMEAAVKYQHLIYEVVDLLDNDYRPFNIKAILEMRGLKRSYSRPPLKKHVSECEFMRLEHGIRIIFEKSGFQI